MKKRQHMFYLFTETPFDKLREKCPKNVSCYVLATENAFGWECVVWKVINMIMLNDSIK